MPLVLLLLVDIPMTSGCKVLEFDDDDDVLDIDEFVGEEIVVELEL